ncbi:hypothetical protein F5B18DRAFT_655623 [Nemania serpens]|nr:hypothetical protein F5B18DRAFT_655623 [Nemania serpens]
MPFTQPVICAVVDFDGVGLSGMYVALDCSCCGNRETIKFEAFSGPDGVIQTWFCSAESPERFQPVNAGDYEQISITFSIEMYFGRLQSPWLTIQANVNPSTFDRHYIKLQFGAGNSTYSVGAVCLPVKATEVVGIELESQIYSEQTGDGTKINNDGESSVGRNPEYCYHNITPASAPLGLPQPSTASVPLRDSPLPSPSLSISTLCTTAEAIAPLALPSPILPVPRSPHTLKLDFSGGL